MNPAAELSITAAFDSGNIRVLAATPDHAALEIVPDRDSDFYQWFHFRVTGGAGRALTLAIGNAGRSAYPGGWPNYRACASYDREHWFRVPTEFADGTLTIRHTPAAGSVWYAYFAPYSYERHQSLVAEAAAEPGFAYRALGRTLDGREIDLLTVGDGPLAIWLYARQHPGESMAEWWMEGALARLADAADPIARSLRARARFHIVPNMNPDGSVRGHLRTNAAGVNLNREWHAPSPARSPEVYHVLRAIDEAGCDFAIDVHGDEAIPYVFLAGSEGIPSLTARQSAGHAAFAAALARRTPDFQTRHGYGTPRPGTANLAISSNQLAERFGCVAVTLEMPFKDNDDLPDAETGWSAERSARLGGDCLGALHDMIGTLAPTSR